MTPASNAHIDRKAAPAALRIADMIGKVIDTIAVTVAVGTASGVGVSSSTGDGVGGATEVYSRRPPSARVRLRPVAATVQLLTWPRRPA